MNKEIYELRVYTIVPNKLPDLIELWTKEGRPIIDKYMNCLCVWQSESGNINEIYHLYIWKGMQERDKARLEFYNDKKAKSYIKKVKPMYQIQKSFILKSLNIFNKLKEL